MIDIHSHILPGVDDGSPDMFDSLLLAELALEGGVDTIIATPHSHAHRNAREHLSHIREAYAALRREIDARGMPLKLLLGMEIFCWDDLDDRFRDGTLLPLNGTDHYLIEFAFEAEANQIRRHIETVLAWGARPVIAHPERYVCLQRKPALAEEWIGMGCQLQMNKDSVFGAFGRKARRTALHLLKKRQYAYAASDAHSPYGRNTQMDGLRDFLEKNFTTVSAEMLLSGNAERYLLPRP